MGVRLPEEGKKALSFAYRSGLDAVERGKAVSLAMVGWLKIKADVAVRSGLEAEQVKKLVDNAVQCGLEAEEAQKILHLAVRSGLDAEETLSAAIRTGLKTEEEIHTCLLQQLLASFDKRNRNDTELDQWIRPRDRSRNAPKFPFFLFKMKASAEKARVSWRMKKYDMFPPERPGYTCALRVARLVIGPDGFRLEQAGQPGGQPGALSYHIDTSYKRWLRPKEGIFKEGSCPPLREVAVIQRMPRGEGISIMSHVEGLGVKLGDILFLFHGWSVTVALTFTEREFHVSSKFKEEPLYTSAHLDFIDITVPVENLIKKLYQMYKLEEQDKRKMQEKQDNQETAKLVCQVEDQKREKLEVRQRTRADRKKYDGLRMEMKSVVRQMKQGASAQGKQGQLEEYEDTCYFTTMRLLFGEPEPDSIAPSDEELCQSEDKCKESLEGSMKLILQTGNLGGGGAEEGKGTEEPSPA
ncbi:uncharacterized protein LOC123430763 [Hordeum vulgare subsp. vulgare]|uniref:Uncharacterized protein n=1 Tax=Hordeum vulgare subsp. vulgare TaxID=112509 RepID=A0A8I6XGN2_HORVV|nr:uncharacterized protein LOC123430763 [Hordeum vulgare subsp. vulgare]